MELKLRAVLSIGDFEPYWAFRLPHEHKHEHQARHQDAYQLTA